MVNFLVWSDVVAVVEVVTVPETALAVALSVDDAMALTSPPAVMLVEPVTIASASWTATFTAKKPPDSYLAALPLGMEEMACCTSVLVARASTTPAAVMVESWMSMVVKDTPTFTASEIGMRPVLETTFSITWVVARMITLPSDSMVAPSSSMWLSITATARAMGLPSVEPSQVMVMTPLVVMLTLAPARMVPFTSMPALPTFTVMTLICGMGSMPWVCSEEASSETNSLASTTASLAMVTLPSQTKLKQERSITMSSWSTTSLTGTVMVKLVSSSLPRRMTLRAKMPSLSTPRLLARVWELVSSGAPT